MVKEEKTALKNTSMLYLMNIAKMVFPLITLPYLTRVLSVECYGIVAYLKAVMQYMQLIMIFGFSLSATKNIVEAKSDKNKIGYITGDVLVAKLILGAISAAVLAVLCIVIPLLRSNIIYTVLAFVNVIITEMLADFLFRGIDRMEVITIRFVIAKTISTILTFIFINGNDDILSIPIFDILGSLAALLMVFIEIRKLEIRIKFSGFKSSLNMLKESFVYFISDMATTAFGALNTVLIGIFIDTEQVAFWSISMQLVAAVQSLYTPITNGIYPTMLRTKSLKFLKKVTCIFMPVVILGCIACYFCANFVLTLVGGPQYVLAVPVFRAMIFVLLFSFPGMLYGWPALAPIGKQKQTSMTTVITAIVQTLGLVLLIAFNSFELVPIALLRGATECLMMCMRIGCCVKYKSEYNP